MEGKIYNQLLYEASGVYTGFLGEYRLLLRTGRVLGKGFNVIEKPLV